MACSVTDSLEGGEELVLCVATKEAAGVLEECFVGTVLDHPSIVQHDDQIGMLNRRESMRDDESRASCEQSIERLFHQFF